MRLFYFIVLFTLVFGAAAAIGAQDIEPSRQTKSQKKKSKIRFDGFYCEPNEDGRSCLRFYKDGLVIDVALAEEVTDEDLVTSVTEWFNRDSDKRGSSFGEGNYKLSKTKLTFSTLHNFGKVKIDYAGTVEDAGDTLVLDMYSNYNGNRAQGRRFEFVQLLK